MRMLSMMADFYLRRIAPACLIFLGTAIFYGVIYNNHVFLINAIKPSLVIVFFNMLALVAPIR